MAAPSPAVGVAASTAFRSSGWSFRNSASVLSDPGGGGGGRAVFETTGGASSIFDSSWPWRFSTCDEARRETKPVSDHFCGVVNAGVHLSMAVAKAGPTYALRRRASERSSFAVSLSPVGPSSSRGARRGGLGRQDAAPPPENGAPLDVRLSPRCSRRLGRRGAAPPPENGAPLDVRLSPRRSRACEPLDARCSRAYEVLPGRGAAPSPVTMSKSWRSSASSAAALPQSSSRSLVSSSQACGRVSRNIRRETKTVSAAARDEDRFGCSVGACRSSTPDRNDQLPSGPQIVDPRGELVPRGIQEGQRPYPNDMLAPSS